MSAPPPKKLLKLTRSMSRYCLTCDWRSKDRDRPRTAAAEAVQHKRANPYHHVLIDREQTRRVTLSDSPEAPRG